MFYSLTGKLIHTENFMAVVSCGGVGYKCAVSFNTQRMLPKVGDEVTLFTHLNVREDAMDLFGFIEHKELEAFKMLTNISGVGAKVGLAILSELTPENVCLAASSGDVKAFTRANGVGPKLASRIVLELKDKVGAMFVSANNSDTPSPILNNAAQNSTGAVAALVALGYNPSEASFAVAKIDSALKTEEIIRQALKLLSQK